MCRRTYILNIESSNSDMISCYFCRAFSDVVDKTMAYSHKGVLEKLIYIYASFRVVFSVEHRPGNVPRTLNISGTEIFCESLKMNSG